jgi:signal transduction histidine kinase
MLDTLRSRFLLSHTLPLLLLIPLVGLALIYFLESQVLLPNLARELGGQAVLLADIASTHPEIWSDSDKAQAFVNQVIPYLPPRVMLLDARGRLLASSDPADASKRNRPLDLPGLEPILAGQTSVHTSYTQRLDADIADDFLPIKGTNNQVVGVIRLTQQLATVYGQFLRLRYFVAGILGVALMIGAAVGLVLALNLEQPLSRTTQAVYRLASGQDLAPLPVQGTKEIRVLLQAFNFLMGRLRTLEEARRQLLSSLVHELGTPLGALNAAIQALRGGAAEEQALREELLLGMTDEVSHLRRLLDDLTRLYDQVSGAIKLDWQPVALSDWLARLLPTWREAALAKGLHWQADIPPDLPTVSVDPDRLAQILGNLLSNAIKYTDGGGTVAVEAARDDERVRIHVTDTGSGISPQEISLIFNPFYRGRATRRFPEGMGLGLTIARDLAVLHGGGLEAESESGQGSRFTLWLPLTLH